VLQSVVKRHAKFLQKVRFSYFNVQISVILQRTNTITVYGFTTRLYVPVVYLPGKFRVVRATLPQVFYIINMFVTVWAHPLTNQPTLLSFMEICYFSESNRLHKDLSLVLFRAHYWRKE